MCSISSGSQRMATLLMQPTETVPDTRSLSSPAFCISRSCAVSMAAA